MAGTWAYSAGSAPATVSVPANAEVVTITARTSTSTSITIDGGDSIMIDSTFDERPEGFLKGPVDIVFGSGTEAYFVSWVAR